MLQPPLAALLAAVALGAPAARAQTCSDPHYRWTEKTDESLASLTPVRTYVGSMLRSWTLLPFTGGNDYRCADRAGRERRVYSVVGWVRRVKKHEADGDWHIELTSRRAAPVDSCIVLEIPPPEYSALYGVAREDLDRFLAASAMGSTGDVTPPVRVRFVGAAFFDGEHRGGPTRRDQTDGSHGRCNASARALWEIHPVYWVLEP